MVSGCEVVSKIFQMGGCFERYARGGLRTFPQKSLDFKTLCDGVSIISAAILSFYFFCCCLSSIVCVCSRARECVWVRGGGPDQHKIV